MFDIAVGIIVGVSATYAVQKIRTKYIKSRWGE